MTPELNWFLLVVRMLFALLAVATGLLALYYWLDARLPRRVRPSGAMRLLTVPAVLVATANLVALGAAMRGNAAAATLADYLSTAMMALLFLWMSAFAVQLRGAARSLVE